MLEVAKFISVPPAPATFALPGEDVPELVRAHILDHLRTSLWNVYYRTPEEPIRDSPLRTMCGPDRIASFHRGAEAEMLALAMAEQPRTIRVQRDSYPGYARIARAVGAEIRYYTDAQQLLEWHAAQKNDGSVHWTVVTTPGNPADNSIPMTLWRQLGLSNSLLVDVAYLLPGSSSFSQILGIALDARARVAFTFSKSLPFASFRFGGLIGPADRPAAPTAAHVWTSLDLALLAAIADTRCWESLLTWVDRQERIKKELFQALLACGSNIVGAESNLFVTVDKPPINCVGLVAKRFSSGLVRIDATETNVRIIREGRA